MLKTGAQMVLRLPARKSVKVLTRREIRVMGPDCFAPWHLLATSVAVVEGGRCTAKRTVTETVAGALPLGENAPITYNPEVVHPLVNRLAT